MAELGLVRKRMLTFVNRTLSLLVYLAYITTGFTHGGGAVALKLAIGFLLPVACIWFPEPLGDYTGIIRGRAISWLSVIRYWFAVADCATILKEIHGADH